MLLHKLIPTNTVQKLAINIFCKTYLAAGKDKKLVNISGMQDNKTILTFTAMTTLVGE